MFKHSEAFSFQIATENQEETDRYWNAIVGNGGQESACGWCKDRWGLLADHPARYPGILHDNRRQQCLMSSFRYPTQEGSMATSDSQMF